jgi:phosphatidate cytidylyltransferase
MPNVSNMTQRVIVAAVAIPVIVVLTYIGGFLFYLFVLAVSSLALLEFYSLLERKGASPLKSLGVIAGILIVTVFFYGQIFEKAVPLLREVFTDLRLPSQWQCLLITSVLFVLLCLLGELFRGKGSATLNLSATVFGVFYVSLSFGTLVGIRELFLVDFSHSRFLLAAAGAPPDAIPPAAYEWGGYTVLSIFASIWICDTAAQFVGLRFGRHKLFPRVSPNKSWEGSVIGFCAAVGTMIIANDLVLPFFTLGECLVVGGVVGLFGQLGDLAESLLKRDAGVKDSSTLIPGHGGVLDRFDSLLFVSPILFLYFDFILG